MKPQRIRTRPTHGADRVQLSGWLHNKRGTYLWIGMDGKCVAILDGAPLYRLAKAIVRRMEVK